MQQVKTQWNSELSVGDKHNFSGKDNTPTLRIEAEKGTFGKKETFQLILSEDAEWNTDVTDAVYGVKLAPANNAKIDKVDIVTKRILEITVSSNDNNNIANGTTIEVPMNVKLDGASGNVTVTIDPEIAQCLVVLTHLLSLVKVILVTTIADTVTFGQEGKELETIRIDETKIGAVGDGNDKKLRLRITK